MKVAIRQKLKKSLTFLFRFDNIYKSQDSARVAQLVERDLAKVEAAGSSPVSRSFYFHKEKGLSDG